MKKFLILIVCIAVLVGSFYLYKHNKFSNYEEKTRDYIVNELKTNPNEIKSITAFQSKGGDDGVTISVIYTDEPNIKYYYKSIRGQIEISETLSSLDDNPTKGKRSVQLNP